MAPETSSRSITAPALGLLVLICLSFGAWKGVEYLRKAPAIPIPIEALSTKNRVNVRPGMSVVGPQVPYDVSGQSWSELASSQKDALAPLATRWDQLSGVQKRHWLNLTSNFESMSEEEQNKFQSRMMDWANLSAQQRSQARLNYAATSTLDADTKRSQWDAYQALSEDERKRLASRAAHKPFGAAVALRPVPAKKLVKVPAANSVSPNLPNSPKIPPIIDYHVPQALPASPAAPAASIVVETMPVTGASAVAQPLPPLNAASAAEPAAPEVSREVGGDNSIYTPQ